MAAIVDGYHALPRMFARPHGCNVTWQASIDGKHERSFVCWSISYAKFGATGMTLLYDSQLLSTAVGNSGTFIARGDAWTN